MNRYRTSDEKFGTKWGFASCHLQAKIPLTLLPKNRVGDEELEILHTMVGKWFHLTIWSVQTIFQTKDELFVRYVRPWFSTLPTTHMHTHTSNSLIPYFCTFFPLYKYVWIPCLFVVISRDGILHIVKQVALAFSH